jgi:hypothetical protein
MIGGNWKGNSRLTRISAHFIRTLVVSASITVIAVAAAGEIVGSVKERDTPKPCAGVFVKLFLGEKHLSTVVTKADGTYRLVAPEGGEYLVKYERISHMIVVPSQSVEMSRTEREHTLPDVAAFPADEINSLRGASLIAKILERRKRQGASTTADFTQLSVAGFDRRVISATANVVTMEASR